jgi:NAD(P)-dependent dehydrogenase (short-subunit alcohol dehydrogenase family)
VRLKDRVAIVTGGAHGIGAGIARCLVEEGARVALVDLDGDAAEATAAQLGNGSIGLHGDAAEESQADAFTRQVIERLGGLDIVVNNAGAGRGKAGTDANTSRYGSRLEELAQGEWDEQLAQNLRTTFVGSKAAVPHLRARGGGSIINVASIAGLLASPTLPAYSAAKAGVISLTKSMALEFAPDDIRVNAICPGLLWTRVWEMMATGLKMSVPAFGDREPRDIFLDIVRRQVPLGREQTPEDIGRLAAFLCSDDARNITGQWMSVDGGITLRGG